MDKQQTRSDERDNKRVFVWGAAAAIVVFLGAITYYLVIERRAERPTATPATQSAPAPRQ